MITTWVLLLFVFLYCIRSGDGDYTCPTGTGWHSSSSFTNYCYYISTTSDLKTQSQADAACVAMGARLASISSSTDNSFIKGFFTTSGIVYYTALYLPTLGTDTGSYWIDGSTSTFRNWALYQPSSAGNCGLVDINGNWGNLACTSTNPYICKLYYTTTAAPQTTAKSAPMTSSSSLTTRTTAAQHVSSAAATTTSKLAISSSSAAISTEMSVALNTSQTALSTDRIKLTTSLKASTGRETTSPTTMKQTNAATTTPVQQSNGSTTTRTQTTYSTTITLSHIDSSKGPSTVPSFTTVVTSTKESTHHETTSSTWTTGLTSSGNIYDVVVSSTSTTPHYVSSDSTSPVNTVTTNSKSTQLTAKTTAGVLTSHVSAIVTDAVRLENQTLLTPSSISPSSHASTPQSLATRSTSESDNAVVSSSFSDDQDSTTNIPSLSTELKTIIPASSFHQSPVLSTVATQSTSFMSISAYDNAAMSSSFSDHQDSTTNIPSLSTELKTIIPASSFHQSPVLSTVATQSTSFMSTSAYDNAVVSSSFSDDQDSTTNIPSLSTELKTIIPASSFHQSPVLSTVATQSTSFMSVSAYDLRLATVVRCPAPTAPILPYTKLTIQHDQVGVVAVYQCSTGYFFVDGGTVRTQCCVDGTWPTTTPSCEAVDCRSSSEWIEPADFSETVEMSCDGIGYVIDGLPAQMLKCTATAGKNGVWSSPPSDCDRFRCGPAPYVENAVAILDQSTFSVKVTCLRGYRFPDGTSVQVHHCNEDGSWPRILNCDVIYCPALPVPYNGSLSTKAVVYETYVNVTCDVGFQQPNGQKSAILLCTDSAKWNDTITDCQPVFCNKTALPSISGAVSSTDNSLWNTVEQLPFGTVISFTCSAGYRLEDGTSSTTVTCAQDGSWRKETPWATSCGLNRCPPVPSVPFATADSQLALNNSIVQYSCVDGFMFNSSQESSVVCLDGNKWSEPTPQCREIHCPQLSMDAVLLNTSSTKFGSTVNIQCRHGYRISISSSRTSGNVYCNGTGRWNPDNATCKPVDCGFPMPIDKADMLTPKTTTYGQNTTYRCFDGYWFYRNQFTMTSTCDATGSWTNQDYQSCTAVQCPRLPFYDVNSLERSVGDFVNVTCPFGQQFKTDSGLNWYIAVCAKHGNWTPDVPQCTGVSLDRRTVTVEAHGAKYFGIIGVMFATTPLILIVILDLVSTYYKMSETRFNPCLLKLCCKKTLR